MFSIILLGTATYTDGFEAGLDLVDLYDTAAEFKSVGLQRKCDEVSNHEETLGETLSALKTIKVIEK
jgi:hypothetical protein